MKELVTLKNKTLEGEEITATYAPYRGMNLVSYRMGGVEVIDQNTHSLFEERCAGLGALIGPHFHERETVPLDFNLKVFPHAQPMLDSGRKDPFSHGIARYVPWKAVFSDTQIQAKLRGSDLYHGIPLSQIEGQDFDMHYEARLLPTGLHFRYGIRSEKPSVLGFHYYYSLPSSGVIKGEVEPVYRDGDEWKDLPAAWTQERVTHLEFPLDQKADFGFVPKIKEETDRDFHVQYDNDSYSLHLHFNTVSGKEFSYQVFHPEKASYVCIEPLSARSPRNPQLMDHTLEMQIQIFKE